jgi:hypothetical protein
MDKELKASWLEALRSGRYIQTQGDLRDNWGFCCLGVLLDVCKHGDWDGQEYVIERDGERLAVSGELEGYARAVGLTTEQERSLIQMNDGKKDWADKPQPFEKIADYIEKNL